MNWDLKKLYESFDDPAFARDMAALESAIDEALSYIEGGKGAPARDVLCGLIDRLEVIAALFARLGNALMLTMAADAHDEGALKYDDRFMRLTVQQERLVSEAARYTGQVEDLQQCISQDARLAEHADFLRELQKEARHTIDPALEETVLTLKLTGGDALSKLRDQLDATHSVHYCLNGEEKELTLSEVRGMAYSADPAVRKAAYQAEIAGYGRIEIPMAACLNGIKGEALTLLRLRNYDSALAQATEQARITPAMLDAMIQSIEEALPAFRRYLRIKAKALGHEGGLPFYDLFAPLGEAGEAYTLIAARAVLVRVLGGFSPEMGRMIERAFDEKWIDAYPRAAKQSGAFCSGVYPLGISYVLTNFEGSLNAVSTLAHELGHAYHDQQLFKNGILNADPPMTLAETASIFNETLLSRALLAQASPAQRVMLLDQELTEATQTLVDILSRFYFEREVFARRADAALSPAQFKQIMLDAQSKTYGDGLDANAMHPYMWACKSHYYSPDQHYYNFPYAFGLLFGKGIYARYADKPDGFVEVYDELLRRTALGDAQYAADVVGIDLSDRSFYRASLGLITEAVDELEALLAQGAARRKSAP